VVVENTAPLQSGGLRNALGKKEKRRDLNKIRGWAEQPELNKSLGVADFVSSR